MQLRFPSLLLLALPCAVLSAAETPPAPQWDSKGFAATVEPFLKEHCLACHGEKKAKGDFRVDTHLPRDFLDITARQKWGEVVNVLNSHEMPPEDEPQPKPAQVAGVVDWITGQMVQAELTRRDGAIMLRRLNRDEYRNTIRDLLGVDWDVSAFPLDPPSGGFDNNGRALVLSPLHMELYVDSARRILDRALVEGDQPASVRWRFEPEEGEGDSHRVELPPKQRPIVHGGKNRKEGGFTVMHHNSWDRAPNARDFKLPHEGEYVIRVRAGGHIPSRADVVAAARAELTKRMEKQNQENPKRAEQNRKNLETDLAHFETDRMYAYGPPRLRLISDLGGQPRVVADFDVTAPKDQPATLEFRTRLTRESLGIRLEYAYSIPSVLENFWMQGRDEFARPEAWLDWFEIEGPVHESWPPESHSRLLFDSPLRATDERAYARAVIARFLPLAWRRPVSAAEVDAKLALYDRARPEKSSFVQAIKTPLVAILSSPNFLYLVEPGLGHDPAKGPRGLTDFELAARLSYFLWSAPPDEELRRLAADKKLRDLTVLKAQTDRLLRDSRAHALSENFAAQWLGLREVGANPPAHDLYPQYDRHLEVSMVGEAKAFFEEVLHQDRPARDFIRSDYAVINERLARFYGFDGVKGDQFRSVPVPPGVRRGGLATMASMLTITSNGTRTSPVKRGVWVLKNLLGTDPGLPVANAGDIAPKVPGIDKATVRQRLEIHREQPQCARCHDKIDPLGLALENFNAAGEWREQEGFGYKGRVQREDPRINAAATMPDGTPIDGVEGLQKALLEREDLFLNALSAKLLTYALGRELGVADQPSVKAGVAHLKKNGGTVRALVHYVVTSAPFRSK